MSAIRQQIRDFITANFLFGQGAETLVDDQSFLETGVIDSTGVLELISFLEQQFEIAVEDQEVVPANLDSVSQLVDFIQRKKAAQGAQVAG
jgi:acyl carrier protein